MMKKFLLLIIGLSTFASLFAGGLVTNTNLSAKFARFLCRDATIGIDAVYFNPAGLNRLEDGFYLSLSNQILNQTRTIGNKYTYLMDPTFEYEGIVKVPIFPSFYAAYKKDNLVFSFGFNPIGGGGGAEFADGLPSFEMMVADLVPILQSQLAPIDAAIDVIGENPGFHFSYVTKGRFKIIILFPVKLEYSSGLQRSLVRLYFLLEIPVYRKFKYFCGPPCKNIERIASKKVI